MKILIVFGSTEGQTRKICNFAMQHLAAGGHAVALSPAEAADGLDPSAFDAVILAASVHAGHYQKALVQFGCDHADRLNAMPTLFLSVSLSAAGTDEEDWRGLGQIVETLKAETGWTPSRVEHIAGAFRFSDYDFFKSWAMRWIASKRDPDATPGEDREYTDWTALTKILDEWAGPLL